MLSRRSVLTATLSLAVTMIPRATLGFSSAFVSRSAAIHQIPRFCGGRVARNALPPEEAVDRAASQVERMQKQSRRSRGGAGGIDPMERLYNELIQLPANALKGQLKARKLLTSGRKPDLARRLAIYELREQGVEVPEDSNEQAEEPVKPWAEQESGKDFKPLKSFCGLDLSDAASFALGKADFKEATPIQAAAIPRLANGESLILHAQTGSGKSLSYLLPITETLWKETDQIPRRKQSKFDLSMGEGNAQSFGVAFILTPTRELAAQIAGVATVLAPPGSVRLITHPTDLASYGQHLKERVGRSGNGRIDDLESSPQPRVFVGSAKAIMGSLYGDETMPAPPTKKPQARQLLQSTRWLVLDEVDRLLNFKRKADNNAQSKRRKHEKPAAIVSSAVARLTLGKAQVISASATVGRPLKRELSRVLGLSPQECPEVVRGAGSEDEEVNDEDFYEESGRHQARAVTIPDTVRNYVTAVDTSTVGKILTNAFYVIKSLNKAKPNRRMLLVLTKGCDINTQTAVAALKHFKCQPEPKSLLDALETSGGSGTDAMMQQHRLVSGATGVGESYFQSKGAKEEACLFVTGEDSIRGLHLDGLDAVIVAGRPKGPDEYTHIAGRTGRAGRPGKVINVLSHEHEKAVKGWETMLSIEFERITMDDVSKL